MGKDIKCIIESSVDSINRFTRRVGGESPAIFLDTGAIIDLERNLNISRVYDKSLNPGFVYRRLESAKYPIFVTDHVLSEVISHHSCNRHNGKPEISCDTLDEIKKFHGNYCNVIRKFPSKADFEVLRYDTYWAGKLAFDSNHKKAELDPISFIDRELIASAMSLRYSENIDSIVIVSSDRHIIDTIEVLSGRSNVSIELFDAWPGNVNKNKLSSFIKGLIGREDKLFDYSGIYSYDTRGRKK